MKYQEVATYFAVFSSYIGAFSLIFIIGFPSPTQKQLICENILDYHTLPIFASISHLTRILGLIAAPLLVQSNINLNTLVTISCLIGGMGYLLIIVSNSALFLIIGVAFVGFYTGIVAIFMFTYIAEVTLDTQRRVFSGGIGFCVRIGLFIAYFAGIWLSFRWLAVVGLIQISLFCILLQLNPLSPVWYVRQGFDDRARTILLYLHGDDFDADTEIQKIKSETLSNQISWIESFKALKDWKVLKPILLMGVIGSLKELGGHEAMVSFSSHILESQQAMDPKVASLFYPICLIAGAIVSISILNYCKLKWLIIFASVFQAISHISMVLFYLISQNYLHCTTQYSHICHTISFWPIFNIALFAFSFALGWGVVYFTLIGIIFTVHRELSVAITDIIANFSSYIVVMVFFFLLHSIGGFATFLIFASVYFVAIGFVYFLMNI